MKNKNFKRKDGYKCLTSYGFRVDARIYCFRVDARIVPQKRMEKFNIKLKK